MTTTVNPPDPGPVNGSSPTSRPYRSRQAARVIVLAGERTLLFHDTDSGVPGSAWWVCPGGGLDAGETFAQAAIRELLEETGVRLDSVDRLIGPVAQRVVWHGYSDQITRQEEQFFLVELTDAEVAAGISTDGHTDSERQRIVSHAWVPLADLDDLVVWPSELARIRSCDWSQLSDWGQVEESTVPIDPQLMQSL